MFYVYVLKSAKTNEYYLGQTIDLKKRFHQHNAGSSKATKRGVPWELLYYEAYTTKTSAIKRENRLKKYGQTWRRLRERLENSK